jgi:hypothetical protein
MFRLADLAMEEIALSPDTLMQVGATSFDHPTLSFLYEYWERKRGNRKMPSRRDIIPSDLKHHLSWVLLADAMPELTDFRYRLVGSLVADYFKVNGTDLTLRQVFAPFGEATMKTVLYIYRKAVSGQSPVRLIGRAKWDGTNLEAYETVYLPLSENGQTANMIFSGFVFDREMVLINRAVEREHGPR